MIVVLLMTAMSPGSKILVQHRLTTVRGQGIKQFRNMLFYREILISEVHRNCHG